MQLFQIDKKTYKILKKQRTNIDRAMLMIGVLGPIATIPQVLTIYINQEVAGLSVFSWGFYVFSSFLTLIYGIVHGLRPLIVSGSLWLVMNSLVVMGCIIYN